jgi:hypothetical protein
MKKLRFLIWVTLAGLAGVVHASQTNRWSFIITCDSRGSLPSGVNDVVLSEQVREILRWNVDFVIYAGDLVYGAGVPPAQFETQLWHWVSVMQPLYNAGIGVYVCRGNHEQGDTWYADPNEPPPKDNYALRWLNVFGSDKRLDLRLPDNGPTNEKYMTYAVAHKNALILALDEYAGLWHHAVHSVSQPWVDSQLQANTKPHVFVFGHEPAFRTFHQDCLDAHPDQRDAFWRSLMAARAGFYTSGHDHYYDNARVHEANGDPNNDIHQLIIATAGAPLYSWSLPYRGSNSDFQLSQLYHDEHWGYVLAEVNDLSVTTTWIERQSLSTSQAGVYKAKFVWQYQVSAAPVVLQPNGGEQVVAGRPYTVRWRVIEGTPVTRVAIDYSLDGGVTWLKADEADNTGSYEWLVPVVLSDKCLIKVVDLHNPSVGDTSDGLFSLIAQPAPPAPGI